MTGLSLDSVRSFSHSFEEKRPNIDTNKKSETVSLWRLPLSGRIRTNKNVL